MKLECRCHGVSGSCSAKTCWRKVPDMEAIGQGIKDKYDESIKVSVQVSKDQPPSLRSTSDEVPPSVSHLVHLKKSKNYCSLIANYTQGRHCVPKNVKKSYNVDNNNNNNNNNNVIIDLTLPDCEELCCQGMFTLQKTVVKKTCNCRFEWCCEILCDDCVTISDTYTCDS